MHRFIQYLEEKLITFNKQAYPKFGNILILAGGAGSGKGFIKSNLVGLEGKSFDVDELKKMATGLPAVIARVKKEMGIDLTAYDIRKHEGVLKDPDKVSELHHIIGDVLKLPKRQQSAFFASVLMAAPDRKPNIIFDVTLKDFNKLVKLSNSVSNLGYDKKNVHIVWVVNHIEVAMKQNLERERVVRADILMDTHRGASTTMHDIVNSGSQIAKYMDGDIVFAFNQIKVDSKVGKSSAPQTSPMFKKDRDPNNGGAAKGGSYIKDANYIYVKRAGSPPTPVDKLSNDIRHKIAQYVPKSVQWE